MSGLIENEYTQEQIAMLKMGGQDYVQPSKHHREPMSLDEKKRRRAKTKRQRKARRKNR